MLKRTLARVLSRIGLSRLGVRLADRWHRPVRIGSAPGRRGIVRRRGGRPYQVFTYHRVHDGADPYLGAVSVDTFRRHMEVVARHLNVLPLEDLVTAARDGDVPPRAAAITFDDGYRDVYENALPVLRDLTLPATVFLVSGSIGSRRLLIHDRVSWALHAAGVPELAWEGQSHPLDTEAGRDRALRDVMRDLFSRPEDGQAAAFDELCAALRVGHPPPDTRLMLGWEEIRAMAAQGVTFGGHTVSHPILSTLGDERIREELTTSKRDIEAGIGRDVQLFAYPRGQPGDFDERVKGVLRETGYQAAVTTVWGTNDSRSDPYELHRQVLWGDDRALLALRMAWNRLR